MLPRPGGVIDMDIQLPERTLRDHWRSTPAGLRLRPLLPRAVRRVSAWDRAVSDFAAAWQLSPEERARLRSTSGTPAVRVDMLVRGVLAEAARLAHETGRAEVSAWCYGTCERITGDASARPTWDEIAIQRQLLEPLVPAAAHGATREALLWWCIRLVPRSAAETLEVARRRTSACALYLTVMAVQAFTAEDAAGRERAGLLAALGGTIARRSRTSSI